MNYEKVGRWAVMGVAALAVHMQVHAQHVQEASLVMGVQQQLEFPQGMKRMAIGDDSVVDVKLERGVGPGNPARLLLTPLKPGSTSLMVWADKSAQPISWLLKVKQAVEVQRNTYGSLIDMDVREAQLTQANGELPVVRASTVDLKSNVVQVDVKVVELNKNRIQQAGINIFSTQPNSHGFSFGLMSAGSGNGVTLGPGGAINGAGGTGTPFSQAFGLLMNFGKANIGLNLGMLEGSGMARVLAEPSLLAISGQSANFLAGGEVPIPVSQGNGAVNIEYKPYGVGLTVSPTVLDNQRIVLKVAPESSELDYANAVTLQSVSVPAITTRKADTTVELGDGESFVIGGLVSQSISSTVNKVPFLSEIPILGTVFKRQEYSRRDRELVIVVTPRLVKPFAANVALDTYLPGAKTTQEPSTFWSRYVGPTGSVDNLPGFSQ